ncbi:MAG: hypothetical protein AB8G22_13540 [Saprospiraceae bacterium]
MPKRGSELNEELRQRLRELTQSGKLPTDYAKIVADQLNQLPRDKPITSNRVSQVGIGRNGSMEIAEAIIKLAEENPVRRLIGRIDKVLGDDDARPHNEEE